MFITRRFNDDIITFSETKEEAVNELLSKYNFIVEETEEEIVEFEGRLLLKSKVDEILAERQRQAEAKFNREFFNTSLGYIRRKVNMEGTGETKDFLSDVLPLLVVGTPVIVYNFMATESHRELATEQFINECKQVYYNDFYPQGVENGSI